MRDHDFCRGEEATSLRDASSLPSGSFVEHSARQSRSSLVLRS